MKETARVFAVGLLLLLEGCVTPPGIQRFPVEQIIRSDLLSFIQDGVTTREQVLLRLGIPAAQFETQRILTYQLRVDKDGVAQVVLPQRIAEHPKSNIIEWEPGNYSLVLVFRPNGVLERHSLVGAQ